VEGGKKPNAKERRKREMRMSGGFEVGQRKGREEGEGGESGGEWRGVRGRRGVG